MIAIVSTLITIVMVVFGGSGAALFAAQNSLPDQPLYSVKLASEDVRASLPATGQTRVGMAMDFADLRLQEALQLAAEGKPIPATVWERMEKHLSLVLDSAAEQDDEQLARLLLQIQARMQAEQGKLRQLQAASRYSSAIEKTQAVLEAHLQLVAIGLSDPAAFRLYMHSDQHQNDWQLDPTATSTVTNQPTLAAPTSTATVLPTLPAPTSTAIVQPTQPVPTNTAIAQPTATAKPKAPAPKAPNPGPNPNGHPHGCCCPWCSGGGSGGHHGGGGWHH